MEAELATFPRLLLEHAHVRGGRPATREKDLGIWQTWTWAQVAAEVRALACGLAALGFKRGMRLAIITVGHRALRYGPAAGTCSTRSITAEIDEDVDRPPGRDKGSLLGRDKGEG